MKLKKDFMGVMLLSNIKIHEIAKKLNKNSKEVLEKARALGFTVKSHLSSVSETDAKKIMDSMVEKVTSKKEPIKETKKETNNKKEKDNGHVIIRREVIIADDDKEKKEQERTNTKAKNQFNEENRKKDFSSVIKKF